MGAGEVAVSGRIAILLIVVESVLAWPLRAQDTTAVAGGRELGGVPAVNYDSDEGFGYGVALELYYYGAGLAPYRYTIQPTVALSTGGKRDFDVFFDAPHVLPRNWRIDAYAATERQRFSPYYGIGNETAWRPELRTEANPDFYAYDRTRTQLLVNLQHRLGASPVRLLLGAGISRMTIDLQPRDRGTTLLAQDSGWTAGIDDPAGWSNFARAGLVWDTRDREVGPRHGTWTELLVQRVDGHLGSTADYTRWTLADRRYFSPWPRLTYANRLLVQKVSGPAPFYDLYLIQTSFKQQEGLGGAKTLRGIPKDRYVDTGLALWNAELRWRATDFAAIGKAWHLVLNGFVDTGRVWGQDRFALSRLHTGYGGGLRLGMGESFVVALDGGHSREATLPIYIGLGYLY